jgi:preprotein translocase subunit SecG
MEQFLRIFSIIITALWLIIMLLITLLENNKTTRVTAGVIALLFAPVFYYIIKF